MDTWYKIVILVLCVLVCRLSYQVVSLETEVEQLKLRIEEVRAEKTWEETAGIINELNKGVFAILGVEYDYGN